MIIKYFNKTLSIFLTLIFIAGLFPPFVFSQPASSQQPVEIRGFNKSVFDSHFSKADREIDPERWLNEAKMGLTQAITAWELIAGSLYSDPALLKEAKINMEKWSNEELEKRFSQWLVSRFFGEAAEKALLDLSRNIDETQKNYSWHLDENGNILFDSNTGDPLVIRPNDEGREFSGDLLKWRGETGEHIDNVILKLYPELLAYIPPELLETMKDIINETALNKKNTIKMEFENIAAREERIFTTRRTRDIWSLRNKSENEAARVFTDRLILETEESCKSGIQELNSRIEQAAAGTGDLALMGEEWLRLYKEQFERGLKAWEDAEEKFFIRRIEWEQESDKLFFEGQEIWADAFNQFEEERKNWDILVNELFQAGEKTFEKISADFDKAIKEAREEFELNMQMRTGEGTARVKALIDMYLVCSSAAISAKDNIRFWEEINNKTECDKAQNMHDFYLNKALEVREKILENYAELFGTGALKDILSPNASSEDFCLDEYQIALVRAKALVLYWERKTKIAQAITDYAGELGAGRMTEAESFRAWEEAKSAYTKSLAAYDIELKKLNNSSSDIQIIIVELNKLALELQTEEEKLNELNADYSTFISTLFADNSDYFRNEYILKYNNLAEEYKKFLETGENSLYKNALFNGMLWGIAEKKELPEEILAFLDSEENISQENRDILSSYITTNTFSQHELLASIKGSLSELFMEYDLETDGNIFPAIQDIFSKIITSSGDIKENSKLFLENFENCFRSVPLWLSIELDNWKTSFQDFIDITLKNPENGEKHWRQYLKNEFITNINPDIVLVPTYKSGMLKDAMYKAVIYTNRLNDSLALLSEYDTFDITESSEYYFKLYYNYSSNFDLKFKSLKNKFYEIANIAQAYEFSIMQSDELNQQLLVFEEMINNQTIAYNTAKDNYLKKAEDFSNAGKHYDEQYSALKTAHVNSDQKRFEYEIQDAIQRWAGTSYINLDTIDLEGCETKLLRAQTVLKVLSELYTDESQRAYNNPEYNALYAAYEENFKRKITIFEAYETVLASLNSEYNNNQQLLSAYQESLYSLGSIYGLNYIDESILKTITVVDGRLAFIKEGTPPADLNDFFNTRNVQDGEHLAITGFEEALRGLSERMAGYFSNEEKFKQWSYARNYILLPLITSQKEEFKYLKKYYTGIGQLDEKGSLGEMVVKYYYLASGASLYSRIKNDNIFSEAFSMFTTEWNNLSNAEKADLEFYTILTLTDGNEYYKGFDQYFAMEGYDYAYKYVEEKYNTARKLVNNWLIFPANLLWLEMRDTNGIALKNMKDTVSGTRDIVDQWTVDLMNNLDAINKNAAAYQASCDKLDSLGLKIAEAKNIGWEDIIGILSKADKNNKINTVKLNAYWESMQTNSNSSFSSVIEALSALIKWAEDEEKKTKNDLKNIWAEDSQKQHENEFDFLTMAFGYINGESTIELLRTAASAAYGNNASSWKTYLDNMHTVLFNDLSTYHNMDINFYSEFNTLAEELTGLTETMLNSRYMSELAAREAEWSQMKIDIEGKKKEWQEFAAIIKEKGQIDWIISRIKMNEANKRWVENFYSERDRVSDEWMEAYLAGLEDKERWLEQVSNAVNTASTEAMLSLVGAEGERLARFIDVREPLGIRDAVPEAQALMSELLQSAGIANIANAFRSITNVADSSSYLVKRGIGGVSVWDTALVKTAAAKLAKETNAEIADSEARKMAYIALLNTEEVLKGIAANVNAANKNFKENIDSEFIFGGLWRRSGNDYVKDIIKGSTIITPVVSTTVTIPGYKNYEMEPLTLDINLHDINLDALESIAIYNLIESVKEEINNVTVDIFGSKDIIGKFQKHVGKEPKFAEKMGKDRETMFEYEGEGELGRLLCEYYYWTVINSIGSDELGLAPWDKRLWNDEGSFIPAPSLRLAGTIVGSAIAGCFSYGAGWVGIGIAIAISSATELTFGTLDIAFGYKEFDEAAFNIGKTILTNTVTSFGGALFNGVGAFEGLSKIALNGVAGSTMGTIITKTMMTGLQTFSTGFTTSLIDGITYGENGFGFSHDIFRSSLSNVFKNSLVSMAGAFTESSLTAINSGHDFSKLLGFNNLNKADIDNFNNLVGSLAGQGVNYALGGDFTLNLLNFSLFNNKGFSGGILELHLGRGDPTFNFGTGGANVSIDNLYSAMKGLEVWDVNSRISNYGKKNDFDALISLRAQYGYGDSVQKGQLWDILAGDVLINKDAEGDYTAKSEIGEDGKKVINLTGYEKDMSMEDQFRLAIALGHEAYRDGYVTDDNITETRSATMAHTEMAIKMYISGEKVKLDQNLINDINEYLRSKSNNDFSSFFNYVDGNYDSSEDFWKLVKGDDGIARFMWDGEYTFDLSEIGIEGRVDKLDNYALWNMYQLGSSYNSFNTFVSAVENFYVLNNVMSAFEASLNVRPGMTISNDEFNNQWNSFKNALQNADNTGLIAEKSSNVLDLNGKNVFANGGGALTCDFGIRVVTWKNQPDDFQWHDAWDIGARGDNRLVAPMDGTLAFTFTQNHGIRLVTSGGNNESITYSHSAASSLRDFVNLYTTSGITMNERGELQGIKQNTIIGVMGNTGKLSDKPHVDVIYTKNGMVQNPGLYFNKNSFPSTPYATSMSGLSNNSTNYILTSAQIYGIYDYYKTENATTASGNFMSLATKSNNFSDFARINIIRRGISL